MSKIKLKICGLRLRENADSVLDIHPDFIGFIFYCKSPRYVGNRYEWIRQLEIDSSLKKVGVFVDNPVEDILCVTRDAGLGFVQLHGNESVETCRLLREKGLRVIKVFSIGTNFSFSALRSYIDHVDYFLFDTRGKYLGGNGIPFDWSLLEDYPYQVPFFLSGGIGIDNIGHVKYLNHPLLYAVDVNSKLELEPGVKDPRLLKKFREEFEKINHDRSEHEL